MSRVRTAFVLTAGLAATTLAAVTGLSAPAAAAPAASMPPRDPSPPVVDIREPRGFDEVAFDVIVRVQALSDVGIDRVDLSVNGTFVGSDRTAPYEFLWDSRTVPNGWAWITAEGTDTFGQVDTSTTAVIVDNP